MGYYTNFDLSDNSEEIIQAIREISGYNCFDEVKWYNHEEDLIKVSLMFPDTEIFCEGDGEEQGDVWKRKLLMVRFIELKQLLLLQITNNRNKLKQEK